MTRHHSHSRQIGLAGLLVIAGLPLTSAAAQRVTLMAANLSGNPFLYGAPAERIFLGLRPDVTALNEWNVRGGNHRAFVNAAFGTGFCFYVEAPAGGNPIPNGIVSRWPIRAAGSWPDRQVDNRGLAWATIDLPGPRDLHVVCVHLKSGTSGADRNTRMRQAQSLADRIRSANWPAADYLVIAGDLNIEHQREPALVSLARVVSDRRPPADQRGSRDTNLPRNQRFDYLLPNAALEARQVPVVLGGLAFPHGLVFDSRLWNPPPPPIRPDDSATEGIQHMGVLKTFLLPDSPP